MDAAEVEAFCQLCSSLEDLIELSEKAHLEVLDFLKNSRKSGKVCKSCFSSKVQLILQIRKSSEPVKQVIEEEEEDDDDVNLEELDQLSSYYAELDDDPDFVPKSRPTKFKSKRLKKLEKIELKCQLCEASFTRIIALRRHFLNDHEDVEKSEWKCRECDEKCRDKTSLISHFIKTHVAINQCKKCGKKFRLARSLR